MEFILGTRTADDIVFVGVGEYITGTIDDESVIHSEEEIDDYLWAYYKFLIVDGESVNDLALLNKVLDRCKTGEVSLIIVNNSHPEAIKAMKPKFSYALPLDGEDCAEKIKGLKELLIHLHTDDHLLEMDDAELRQLFDGERLIDRYSLFYRGKPSQHTVFKDVQALALNKNAGGTLLGVFVPDEAAEEDNIAPLYALVEHLIEALPDAGRKPIVWNIYRHPGLNAGELRLELLRTRPKAGVMETLRTQNELLS